MQVLAQVHKYTNMQVIAHVFMQVRNWIYLLSLRKYASAQILAHELVQLLECASTCASALCQVCKCAIVQVRDCASVQVLVQVHVHECTQVLGQVCKYANEQVRNCSGTCTSTYSLEAKLRKDAYLRFSCA